MSTNLNLNQSPPSFTVGKYYFYNDDGYRLQLDITKRTEKSVYLRIWTPFKHGGWGWIERKKIYNDSLLQDYIKLDKKLLFSKFIFPVPENQ